MHMVIFKAVAALAVLGWRCTLAAPMPVPLPMPQAGAAGACQAACQTVTGLTSCPTTSLQALQACACAIPNFATDTAVCLACSGSALTPSQRSALQNVADSCSASAGVTTAGGAVITTVTSAVSSVATAVSSAVSVLSSGVPVSFWLPTAIPLSATYGILGIGGTNTSLVAIETVYYTNSASATVSTGLLTELVIVQPSEAVIIDGYGDELDVYECEQMATNGTGDCIVAYGSSVSGDYTFTYTETYTGLNGALTTLTAIPAANVTASASADGAATATTATPILTGTSAGGSIGSATPLPTVAGSAGPGPSATAALSGLDALPTGLFSGV